jgi:hypothetical protein
MIPLSVGVRGVAGDQLRGGSHAGHACFLLSWRLFFELADIAANTWRGQNAKAISPIALDPEC